MNKIPKYWVYMLYCDNGHYYTGYTTDLNRRYQEHCNGTDKCKYTRSFKPLGIAQYWQVLDKSLALQIERFIKKLSRTHKKQLVLHPEQLLSSFPGTLCYANDRISNPPLLALSQTFPNRSITMPTKKSLKTKKPTQITAKPKAALKAKSPAKKKIKPIPKGYTSVTPYLFVENAVEALKFYKKTFGAKETMRFAEPKSKKILHAEIQIGDSMLMLAEECPEMHCHSPKSMGGSPVMIHLYVEKVDAVVKKAVSAGATLLRPVEDQFYGDRLGCIADPFGHLWSVSTHVEEISPKEIQKRFAAMKKQ